MHTMPKLYVICYLGFFFLRPEIFEVCLLAYILGI